jgi:3'-phosphoadenosine 5'-phosphosulfate sulfotransferase (PAPS reductase)/FAD synthetase
MLDQLGKYHCKTGVFKKRLYNAVEVAKAAFEISENPCLNISGGKDSVAMLAVVSEAAKQLKRSFKAWIHISDASYPETIETTLKACELCDVELIISESPISAFDVNFQKEVKKFGKEGVFFSEIKKNIEGNNFDLCFIGNRMYESKRRLKACLAHGEIYNTTVPTKHICCTPIMRFKVEDVAATIELYKLPWHPIYFKWHDRNWDKIRLGYITAQDLMEMGTIVFLKTNYPDLYNKLSKFNPKIRQYA